MSIFKTTKIELMKMKRLKINMVGIISVILSIIISTVQMIATSNSEIKLYVLIETVIWNNITLIMPFSIALVGGYYINREYVEDTQKNIFMIPVDWNKIIKAKIILIFLFSLILGIAEWILSIVTSLIYKCDGLNAREILFSFCSLTAIHLCMVIAILPIILIATRKKGTYIWGALLAMVSGVLVVFISNGEGVNLYPLTVGLSLIHFSRIPRELLSWKNSIISLIMLCLVSYLIYRLLYNKKRSNCY